MGEILLYRVVFQILLCIYSSLSPGGKDYYITSFAGGKSTMGEKLLYKTGQ